VDAFGESTTRRVLRWLVVLKIAGVILLFDPAALQSFELPKTVFSHALAWPLAALVLVALWQYGSAIFPRSPINIAVGALAVVWVASTAVAADRYLAVFGDPTRYEGLTYLADMLVLYAAVSIAFREPRDFVLPAKVLAGATVIALSYALIQRFGLDPVNWSADSVLRPFSVFGNPDIFGHFLSLTFGVAVGVATLSAGVRVRLVRAVAIALVVAIAIAGGVVATRGTLVGMAAAITALPFTIVRARGFARSTIVPLAVGTVGVVALAAALLIASPLGARVRATITEGTDVRGRVLIYEAALQATRDRPLLGWGPDGFAAAYPNYRTSDPAGAPGNQPESSAHSWLLEASATTGILGALALLAAVVITTERLYRIGLRQAPAIAGPLLLGLVAYWAHGLVSVGSISVDWFGWAGLGAAAGLTMRGLPSGFQRRVDPAGSAVVVGASCLVALAGLFALDASHLAASAQAALTSQRFDAAVASASAAASRDSGRAAYREMLGLAYAGKQRWRESADAFAQAAKRAPYIATYYSNLARNRTRQSLAGDQTSGGPDAALDAARRAVVVDPNNWESESVLAEVQNAFGQPELSLQTIAVAVALNRNNPSNDAVAEQAAAKVTDPARARLLLERILAAKESSVLRLTLSRVALRLNDRPAALMNAQRALELDPTNGEAKSLIASLGG
jgi:O-antigen ligase